MLMRSTIILCNLIKWCRFHVCKNDVADVHYTFGGAFAGAKPSNDDTNFYITCLLLLRSNAMILRCFAATLGSAYDMFIGCD